MALMIKNFVLILFLFSVGSGLAQKDTVKPVSAPLLGVHFGGDLPFADMGKRYGANLTTGLNFMYKTNKNFLFGIDFNYGFGRNMHEDVLAQMKNSDGFLVDNSGYPADLRVSERIVDLVLHAGKLLPLGAANKNSGLMLDVGLGYMQHRIHFLDANVQVAAVSGVIANGFDRLTNGIVASQFVGYMYLSDSKLLNFYVGVESYEGHTKSVRKINYDTGLSDNASRLDVLLGLRMGWILPLYSRTPKNYFYN
jgi:hypothetical protein